MAAKIFKNNRGVYLRQFTSIRCQFLSIHGYIWCWCHTSFWHRQINVQFTAAQMWFDGYCLVHFSYVLLWQAVAPNSFCVLQNDCVRSELFEMFFELIIVLRNKLRFWHALLVALMHLPNGICVKTLPLAGERQGDTANHRRAHDSRVWVKGERCKV